MEEESQTEAAPKLDGAILSLWFVWLGILLGSTTITILIVSMTMLLELDVPALGGLEFIFLAPAPLGLVAAYFILPQFGAKRPGSNGGSAEGFTSNDPKDPMYWFGLYASLFFIKLGLLEGPMIMTLIGFLLTNNWIILFMILPLFAAVITEKPAAARYLNWVESARQM